MIFFFSGCGNSRHVAETLAANLNDTLVFIPEAVREGRYEYELAEGERLGFVFPIYAWGPPKLVMDFVGKLSIKDGPSTPSTSSGTEGSGTLMVYPNPVSEVLYIQGVEPAEVQVFNALGQWVRTIKNENQINVSDWAEGVYVLRIATADGKVFDRKVTVK